MVKRDIELRDCVIRVTFIIIHFRLTLIRVKVNNLQGGYPLIHSSFNREDINFGIIPIIIIYIILRRSLGSPVNYFGYFERVITKV